jgi:hypothetical protein
VEVRVDVATGLVSVGEQRWPVELDCRTGSATVDAGGTRLEVVPLRWIEKRRLARWAHLGPDFVAHQRSRLAGGGDLSAHEAAVVGAVAAWLDAGALPLDARLLSTVTLDVCRGAGLALRDLDDRDATEVEAMWSAVRDREGEDPAAEAPPATGGADAGAGPGGGRGPRPRSDDAGWADSTRIVFPSPLDDPAGPAPGDGDRPSHKDGDRDRPPPADQGRPEPEREPHNAVENGPALAGAAVISDADRAPAPDRGWPERGRLPPPPTGDLAGLGRPVLADAPPDAPPDVPEPDPRSQDHVAGDPSPPPPAGRPARGLRVVPVAPAAIGRVSGRSPEPPPGAAASPPRPSGPGSAAPAPGVERPRGPVAGGWAATGAARAPLPQPAGDASAPQPTAWFDPDGQAFPPPPGRHDVTDELVEAVIEALADRVERAAADLGIGV